ncbi:hypothetical protein F2Q69_00034690 [Brassica cretica]|uniref:F-box domain-containing protein n=1 Tax=Brassica cretica TaxID=69181 RepID=A0A8S9SEX2_BRACR|nr:hypothetical protein F2Q69_00034690 [Brassica cretica]
MNTQHRNNVSGDCQSINRRHNKRSKTSDNGREGSALPIPTDLIIEIFSRLSLKSIAICRCVSKLWASILRLPDFTDLFLTKSSARTEGERETVLFICNPSTRQVLHLPKVKTSRPVVRSTFGYDPIHKKFKVLCMTRLSDGRDYQEHQVLTLGAPDRSWRMLECCIPHYGYPPKEICLRSSVFIEVKVTLQSALLRGALINYSGKLGLFISEDNGYFRSSVSERSTSVQLWVLEDVEKQEWSDHIYLLPDLWKNLVGRDYLFFAGVTRTNEIVLAPSCPSYPSFYLCYLNTKRDTVVVRFVEIQGIDVSDYYMDHVVLDHVEDVKLYDV